MVHRSIRIDSRVVDKFYIKRGWLVLENLLFFSLYRLCFIAYQDTSLKQLKLLSCLDSSKQSSSTFWFASDLKFSSQISQKPDPTCYTRAEFHYTVTDVECAYIPLHGVSIVSNHVLFPVGIA